MIYRIEYSAVQSLIEALHERKYTVIGPIRREGSIVYDELQSSVDLPKGWTDEQGPGYYRTRERSDGALFGFSVGPHSWKKYLYPPILKLVVAARKVKGFAVSNWNTAEEEQKPLAFLGVRPCELAAITIQDKVFGSGDYQDPNYKKVRDKLFVVAVNCSSSAETCFCNSMGTGPKARGKFDLALTEILEKTVPYYLVEVGSTRGQEVLAGLAHRPAERSELERGEEIIGHVAKEMKRSIDTSGIKELLYSSAEHREWEKVGERCLTCANCTMVCPTCFCNTVEDSTDLSGSEAVRTRKWDSCFTLDFSYIHGGSVRTSAKARYRQWMTHKLAAWIDQFGTSGCVGCGRCITWCPVGIDITDEARVVRENNV
ncbi:MAG TPA: 4Fe-4S dicluster domain-containing protein [Bacteroidota bacterium]